MYVLYIDIHIVFLKFLNFYYYIRLLLNTFESINIAL